MSLAALDPHTEARTSPDFVKLWKQAAEGVNAARPKRAAAAKERTAASAASRYRHLLMLRFALTNIAAFALAAAFEAQGWVSSLVLGDDTGLTGAIVGVFLIGLAVAGWKAWELNIALTGAEEPRSSNIPWIVRYVAQSAQKDAGARSIASDALKLQLAARLGFVKHIANSLVLLGLIGTVIGFIIALAGISADSATDANGIAPMIGELIHGMSVALVTTLVGAVLNLWLMVNYHMLIGGATRLVGQMVAAAEDAALEAAHAHA